MWMRQTLQILSVKYFILLLCVASITALAIYLTPLKHLNLVAPEPRDIEASEFWNLYQTNPNKYFFVDVRDVNAYARSHARGSVNHPIGTLYEKRYEFPTNKTIVLICTSGSLAAVGYGFLEHWGYTNLLRVNGGLQEWIIADLPFEGENTSAPLPERD
jgi:rhodanese-related sulfurtransferase